ncbi:SRPBCC family protein [Chryseomicrobium sp. FSL W7-1435]|uniref:SRPBCC family protein n=1 Tax=Chryseomicrobium sp. FSL W7-1435 TaxID=2921704 RepID=UPI00315A6BF5
MPTIHHEIFIQAPIAVCFDLARNIDVHIQTTGTTNERAVAGVTSGLIENGQTVTWEATHLGVRQKLTAKIIDLERPYRFVDTMVNGAFHSFTHIHEFVESGTGTIMKDTFSYKSPLGVLGIIADKLFLERYMREFIVNRAEGLKKIAEENLNNDK